VDAIGPSAGVGLKPAHFDQALAWPADGLWFEVHPENYMVAGGPRLSWLEAIRERHPVSLHGVAASLAADADPDPQHLRRLAELVRRLEPVRVSEHLAWSSRGGTHFPDLLPFPRTRQALDRMAANVGRLQDALRCRVSIENPSHYLRIDGHDYDEVGFLTELAARTGCGLLLDVNNVFVSARNLNVPATDALDAFPASLVTQIHLAGHAPDQGLGTSLLIDSHDQPVAEPVWALFERVIARIGPRPTLIERDDNLPGFDVLLAERARADAVLSGRHHQPACGSVRLDLAA
jgi:uncharacterized protein (UPF0276 family)